MARDHGEYMGRTIGCRRCGRRRGLIDDTGYACAVSVSAMWKRNRLQKDELR